MSLFRRRSLVFIDVRAQMFSMPRWHADLRNVFVFTSLFLSGSIGGGLLLALFLDRHLRGYTVFRNIFLFPLPIYVMVVTGVKQSQNVSLSTMWQLPAQLSGGGFMEAWRRLYPNLGNSLQLTVPATIIVIVA